MRLSPVLRKSVLLTSPTGDAIGVLGLQKSFGDWPVLWDLDLTVPWGELLVLFGANGVGKTTLLRILSTQARPDAGSLVIAGFDLRRSPQAVRRRVGVVAHQTFHYDDLTCRENLHYYGRLFGLQDYRARADEVSNQAGAGPPRRPPGTHPLQRYAESACPSPAPSSTGPGCCC